MYPVHRAWITATREITLQSKALVFVLPEEVLYVEFLHKSVCNRSVLLESRLHNYQQFLHED